MTDQTTPPGGFTPAVNLFIHLATALALGIDVAHVAAPAWLQSLIGCGQDGALLSALVGLLGFAHAAVVRPAGQSFSDARAALVAWRAGRVAQAQAAGAAFGSDLKELMDGITETRQQVQQIAQGSLTAQQLLQAMQAAGVPIPNPAGFLSSLPANRPQGTQQ